MIVSRLALALAVANHPDSKESVPDPYHPINDVLLHSVGGDSSIGDETFAGEAYTLHIAIDWLARRDYRKLVERVWPGATHLLFAEFKPATPAGMLSHEDPEGEQHTWTPTIPTSWATLRTEAKRMEESSLPPTLWQNLHILPYLPLLFPYRFTNDVAKALDYMTLDLCEVSSTEILKPADVG